MERKRRKNLRGFLPHFQALVNRIIKEEFPELSAVDVRMYVIRTHRESALAHWLQVEEDNRIFRFIMLNTRPEENRAFLRSADDAELENLIRHELLHGELQRQGRPFGDNDIPFVMECLRRRIAVDDISIDAFEEAYGSGSYALFERFLPDHSSTIQA